MSQLPLLAGSDGVLGDEFLRILRLVVDRVGLKQAAGELDCSHSFLSNCLMQRGTNHLRASWVPWLLKNDVSGDALAFLAACCGKVVGERKVMTPEQELAALKKAIATNLGVGMQAALMASVERGDR